jgi:CRISPR-associated protein Csd1
VILQALNECYERLQKDHESNIPSLGFAFRPISFVLIIDRAGKLLQVQDLRDSAGKKMVPRQLVVPSLGRKKSVGIAPDFLWGPTGYVLGMDEENKPRRTAEKFSHFKKFQHELGDGLKDAGMSAVLKFLDKWNPSNALKIPIWNEIAGTNLIFRLDSMRNYVHESPVIQQAWTNYYRNDDVGAVGKCLVSGKEVPIARLHLGVKGVGTVTAEGALVSFNEESSCSYGKEQNFNAPIGKEAAFGYATALNYLLRRDNRHCVKIADAMTVFWTARSSSIEGFMGQILNPSQDEGDLLPIRLFLEALRDGKTPVEFGDPDMPFFILGLSPNAARISVRFWHVSTVGDMAARIGQHFRDLAIVRRYDNDPEFPAIWQLLRQTAVQGKSENIPPMLAGTVMRSILTGAAYPQTLLSAIISRIRADQEINYLRAAIIKACLIRKFRISKEMKEVKLALDKESKDIAYRLGRLFAVLEKAQMDAVPGANTTIKDRFYGSASATPRVVFPQLLRLSQHHTQKAERGRWYDKLIGEAIGEISQFPAHLSLEEQGMFAIGYYHQRQSFFTKSENKKEEQ